MQELVIRKNSISKKENEIEKNDKNYKELINIYSIALTKVKEILIKIQKEANLYSGYDVISNVSSRIKSYDSIIKKMQKKGYSVTYESLIENINDIAGVRVTCMSENDIYKIVKVISNLDDVNIIKEKDYIKKHKKSGYSAYHVIVEVPIYVQENQVWVKVEIQIRTIGMDFWSILEHKVKYKSDTKLSRKNSSKLKFYATIISKINNNMAKMYKNNYKYIEN